MSILLLAAAINTALGLAHLCDQAMNVQGYPTCSAGLNHLNGTVWSTLAVDAASLWFAAVAWIGYSYFEYTAWRA